MRKRNSIITLLLIFFFLPINAQVKKQVEGLKREVTLYNPYKPTLPEAKKRSFLPDMKDTSTVRPDFHYNVKTTAFLPEYTISPIKAASLLPDPLTKLYKSYVKIGAGNYYTPLAELSITNERSKKGAIGFYGRHFSTNGRIDLPNGKDVYAGYMDNDASLFGKRFFRKNLLEGSIDYSMKNRYAYGYNPIIMDYSPPKKDIKLPYNNIGAKAIFSSVNLDSAEFTYDFRLSFNYFTASNNMFQRNIGFSGMMSKLYNGFYVGSGLDYDYYRVPDILFLIPKYIAAISPFIKKSSEQWSFKLGIQALLDRNLTETAKLHIYPDVNFSFNVVPEYINFFAAMSGKLERNEPLKVISENPFLLPDGRLFMLPNTSHDLILSTGLKGNTGIGGNYILSASYSLISNMLFYSNINRRDTVMAFNNGNYFTALTDDVELFNIHGEMSGKLSDKMSFKATANIYKYTPSGFDFAWNRPGWDGALGLKYNLRDKIIAGMDIGIQGKRKEIVNGDFIPPASGHAFTDPRVIIDLPVQFNLSLNAEYRYSKILSFWTKLNQISNSRYYEWAFYPTHGFLFMLGFTYSL